MAESTVEDSSAESGTENFILAEHKSLLDRRLDANGQKYESDSGCESRQITNRYKTTEFIKMGERSPRLINQAKGLFTKLNGRGDASVTSDSDDWLDGRAELMDATKPKDGTPREPFFYCRWVTNRPYLVFCVTLLLHISVVVLSAILYFVDYPIIRVDFRGLPLELRHSEILLKEKSWMGFKYRGIETFKPSIADSPRSPLEKFYMVYDTTQRDHFGDFVIIDNVGGNVLLKENLKKLQRFEKKILDDPNHHCMGGHTSFCPPYSVLRLFDGSLLATSLLFYDPNFDNVAGIIKEAMRINGTRAFLEPLLAKDAVITDTSVVSKMTFMSFYASDYPTNRKENLVYWMPIFDEWHSNGYEGLEIYMTSVKYYIETTLATIYRDIYLIIGSCIFIFLFIWFETNSFWLSSMGIASTLFSFVTGNFIYAVILTYRYFGILNILAVFIIFGVAADDIFIFCDTWKSTAYDTYQSVTHRMSVCYLRAAKSMFITSLTTAAAFFASSFSSILLISSFGTFAGVIVLVNYLSVVIFYPSVIMIYHLKFEKLCCAPNSGTKNNRIMVRFLSGPYFSLIKKRIFQVISLVCVLAYVGVSVYYITTIRVETREPKLIKSSEKLEQHLDLRYNKFRSIGPIPTGRVFVIWGFEKYINRTLNCGEREFRRSCYWEWDTYFDPDFDLNPVEAQRNLLDFCKFLKSLNETMMDSLRVHKHPITGEREIYCIFNGIADALDAASNVSFPMTPEKVTDVHQQWKLSLSPGRNFSNIGTSNRSVEDMYRLWEYNSNIDKVDYYYMAGIDHENPPEEGERFAYIGIKIVVNMDRLVDEYPEGLALYEKWEALADGQISKMAPSLRGGFQTSTAVWSWFELMQALVQQGIVTVCVGVCIAWVILVASCGNWIIGTMATACIASICVSVLGIIGLVGWKYGVLETVNTTLVVGLAIDYVVHFGVSYTSAPSPDRSDRVQYALREIGLPVVSGAITTLGSSFFMLFSKLQFLFQFSIFMFSTIGFSIFYCMTVFLMMLLLVGPQGTTGSTAEIYKRLRRACCHRGSQCNIPEYKREDRNSIQHVATPTCHAQKYIINRTN